jgi:hypothetical protein
MTFYCEDSSLSDKIDCILARSPSTSRSQLLSQILNKSVDTLLQELATTQSAGIAKIPISFTCFLAVTNTPKENKK